MFSNIFTEYLTNNGWLRVDPMTFESQENTNVQIFFDNSNQIEIYNRTKRVATYYIVEIDQLIRILNSLSDFPILPVEYDQSKKNDKSKSNQE